MGLLNDLEKDLKKEKRKLIRDIQGETKGERWNRRRLKMAQEAWSRYSGPMSRNEFMSWYMKKGVARSKKAVKKQASKWDKKALAAGKKLTVEKVMKIMNSLSLRRTPRSEAHFLAWLEKHMPGGLREYGEFEFGGTTHRPDFYINKDIVFELKIVRSNTELHTAIGQALIYSYKYPYVFLLIYDARHGYDAVELIDDELDFLWTKQIVVIQYPD